MLKKLNSLLTDDVWYLASLLVLTALASFALGRYSVLEGGVGSHVPAITLSSATIMAQNETEPSVEVPEITVIASKNGTKYHLPSCPGAKQIAEQNKIEFSSRQAAEAAGYTPAANCQF